MLYFIKLFNTDCFIIAVFNYPSLRLSHNKQAKSCLSTNKSRVAGITSYRNRGPISYINHNFINV
uniref:Uncharacterized protein n=1 Tax=Heterorhabditis bacteriophora TaxID=37862 RepID=A0A1I7W736_HETBA